MSGCDEILSEKFDSVHLPMLSVHTLRFLVRF
jgi:hypothetical protein